jgi:hypothetical protein
VVTFSEEMQNRILPTRMANGEICRFSCCPSYYYRNQVGFDAPAAGRSTEDASTVHYQTTQVKYMKLIYKAHKFDITKLMRVVRAGAH